MGKRFFVLRFPNVSPRFTSTSRLQSCLQRRLDTKTKIETRFFGGMTRGASTSQRSIPAAYWRGGTSRAVIFQRKDLPVDELQWPSIFLRVLGSPDKSSQQLDGLGAGIPSLSKVSIVSPSTHPLADIDYTFAAIGITSPDVDFSANCGNILSAVGPFAYNHGLVPRTATTTTPEATVRIHNTNTNKLIHSTFPTTNSGKEAATAGVPGTGAEIKLQFLDPAASRTPKLLPTGNVIDRLDGIEVSCIDAANPCVFVRAADLAGSCGRGRLPDEILDHDVGLLRRLEELRCLGAKAMGLRDVGQRTTPRTVPKICVVGRPGRSGFLGGGGPQLQQQGDGDDNDDDDDDDVDVVARVLSDQRPHRAIPLTVAVCMAVAARVRGSVVEECLLGVGRVKSSGGVLTIGHPSGVVEVRVEGGDDEDFLTVKSVGVSRTARLLMEGLVFY